MKKYLLSILIVILLLLASVSTVLAQEPDPSETPEPGTTEEMEETETPEPEEMEETHPIWQLIRNYFDLFFKAEPTEEPTEEPTGEPTEEPTGEPTEEPTGEPTEEPTEEPTLEPTVPVEEGFFSTLREGGLGFGLIAKLVGIFGNQQECDPTLEGAECPMPIEQYVQEGGKLAPGQLFKEYGKPTILGVGHLRKAVQEKLQATAEAMEGEMDDTLEMEEDADQLKIKNKDQEGRTNNGNGVGVPGGGKIKNKTNGKKK